MIGRIAWTAGLVCVGAVTAVLQTDRQSELNPELAAAVPPMLRSYAQRAVAVEAVKEQDPATGLAAAKALVRRRPMPAENLTILALAQAKAGDVKAAGLTIQLAGKRGWREPLAQEAVLRLALEAGDKPEAARRFAAMFRNGSTPDEKLIALAPQVLGEPRGGGQETFATIIAAAPLWHEQFFQRGARVLPSSVFAEVIDLALDRNAQFPCGHLNAALAGLRQRDAAAADRLAGPAARRCR
jgi:hypothetical protein